jgi:hypothetical protein
MSKLPHAQHAGDDINEYLYYDLTSHTCTKRDVDSDDNYYESQKERRKLASDKETLEKVYQTLLEEHRTLQTSFVSFVVKNACAQDSW